MRSPWQMGLQEAITDPLELIRLLQLDPSLGEAAQKAASLFPLKVPRQFVAQMVQGDVHDPLLRQVLPLGAELALVPGYQTDPLKEADFNPLPGLLHKYRGRVLVTVTGACGVHCRYCFRRSFPYEKNQLGPEGRAAIVRYVSADPSITEVILSGGDPLVAPDTLLAAFSEQLAAIPHLRRLRIHTRLPLMLPERLVPELAAWLQASRLQTVMVLHCNHPREISETFRSGVASLRAAGVTLLNQSVLLAGVNDTVETLAELSESLFSVGILPYYLHIPDKVQGTAHFDLPQADAIRLHEALSARLPGYLVPRLVTEVPGSPAKTPLSSKNLYTGQS